MSHLPVVCPQNIVSNVDLFFSQWVYLLFKAFPYYASMVFTKGHQVVALLIIKVKKNKKKNVLKHLFKKMN